MKKRASILWLAMMLGVAGCQTQWAGQTLPSPRYLEHLPQFIPSDPEFPLTNELAYQQGAAAQGLPGGPPIGPRPVPPR
jgi:hypothetical protein